jgi:hypothetical protein
VHNLQNGEVIVTRAGNPAIGFIFAQLLHWTVDFVLGLEKKGG